MQLKAPKGVVSVVHADQQYNVGPGRVVEVPPEAIDHLMDIGFTFAPAPINKNGKPAPSVEAAPAVEAPAEEGK